MQAEPAAIGRFHLGPRITLPGSLPVYLAREPVTGRDVTLALAPAASGAGLRESLAMLTAVSHPHLAAVQELVEDGPTIAAVLALPPVRSLRQQIAEHGPLNLAAALTVAEQVAGALEALHARALVHGACTPESVVLTADGRALLLPPLHHAVQPSSPPGGLPEAQRGEALTPRTDVYGLAATLVAALTGHSPAPGRYPGLPETHPAEVPRALPPTVPGRMTAVLMAALHPHPDARPDGPAALVAQLRAALAASDAGFTAPPAPASVNGAVLTISPGRPPRRSGRIAWAAAALTGVIVLAGSGFALARQIAAGNSPAAAIAPVLPATAAAMPSPAPGVAPAMPSPAPGVSAAEPRQTATPATATPSPRAAPERTPAPPAAAPAPVRTPPADGGARPPAPEDPPGAVLLADDFASATQSVLPFGPGESGRWAASIEDGEYVIRTIDPGFERLASTYLTGAWADTSLRLDVRLTGAGSGRIVTLGCRKGERGAYRLTISFERNELLIARWDAGVETPLGGGWTRIPSMLPAEARNRIEFICAGDTLTARVNNLTVATARDKTYTSGRWWFGAGLFSDMLPGTITAHFDNLRLSQR